MRPALTDEALRLGRMLAGLAPDESEVQGLLALMELQASRMAARVDAAGRPILLADQNRARWDHLLIRRGLAALDMALAESSARALGPYALQAAIAACHARAPTSGETDWVRMPPCTTRWHKPHHRRWWSSTAPWRSAWPSDRRPGWPSSMRCAATKPCRITSGCSHEGLAESRGSLRAAWRSAAVRSTTRMIQGPTSAR